MGSSPLRIHRAGPVPHVFISGDRLRVLPKAMLKPFRLADLLLAIDRALAAG